MGEPWLVIQHSGFCPTARILGAAALKWRTSPPVHIQEGQRAMGPLRGGHLDSCGFEFCCLLSNKNVRDEVIQSLGMVMKQKDTKGLG